MYASLSNSPSPQIKKLLSKLQLCQNSCRRYVIYILFLLLCIFPFHEYYRYKFNFAQWDLLLFTGLIALMLGLYLVGSVHVRFHRTVERLLARETLKIADDQKNLFLQELEAKASFWARCMGIVAAIAMLTAFAIALSQVFYWPRAVLGIGETIGAYIAGNYLGRMASYGLLGWQLEKESIQVVVQPAHVDGVAGLKPIGDFYFHQAMITAIPAIYLAVWWFLFPIWPRDYSHWEGAYLILLTVALTIEVLAFMVPIWAFHRIMLRAKEKWLEEADKLSTEISELRRRKEGGRNDISPESLSEQIEGKTQRYWAIETMPTWPIDIKTKRRFQINNVLLFIPLLGDIAKRNIVWKDVIDLLKKLG